MSLYESIDGEDRWFKPTPYRQREMFDRDLSDVLAIAGVTRRELRDWKMKGWLTFDDSDGEDIEHREWMEILFVRDLVRGLRSDEMVNHFLAGLEKPYSYDTLRVAYSFHYGWVRPP